jgi:hypothetical protein
LFEKTNKNMAEVPRQYFPQLAHFVVGRDPPRLFFGEHLRRRPPAGLFLVIEIAVLLPAANYFLTMRSHN